MVCDISISTAQAVQKIGNLDKEVSKGKEEWMAPLAFSIASYTEQVKDFLDRLMDVEDKQGIKSWICKSSLGSWII